MNKIALITGGTGYIGSWVCKYLLEEGYTPTDYPQV
jgi:nucleoside-diphosphate-sugar epimerase